MKRFNFIGHHWHNIEPEKNKNMQKAGYVLITRPVNLSGLKKGRGMMVTAQSIKPCQLPEKIKKAAENIVNNYKI